MHVSTMQPKRKVAHLTSVHAPSDPRIAFRECGTLARAGYDVVLIAPGPVPDLPPGVRVHSLPLPANRFQRMTRTMWQVYRAARDERAQVYHFHDPELMFVGLALRMTGARVVFDVHEDIPLDIMSKEWITRALRGPISRATAFALRMLHRNYSAVVAATPSIAQNFDEKNTVIVCNYPTLEGFASLNGPLSAKPPSAIYVGNITELRGIYEMVRALESPEVGPDVRLTLVGRFEDEELERRVRSMEGWKRVDYLGWRAPSDIPNVLRDARAGMLLLRYTPSFVDSLPTKLYEYMGAGLPVIVAEFLQCSQLVREYNCGIVVDPSDTAAVARAMTHLIQNPAEAQAMGERGRTLVNERYQWNSEANKLTNLYAAIA